MTTADYLNRHFSLEFLICKTHDNIVYYILLSSLVLNLHLILLQMRI